MLGFDAVGHHAGNCDETSRRTLEAPDGPEPGLEPLGLRFLRPDAKGDVDSVIALAETFDRGVQERYVFRADEGIRRNPADELVWSEAQDRTGRVGREPDRSVEVVKRDEVGERGEHGREFVVARKRPYRCVTLGHGGAPLAPQMASLMLEHQSSHRRAALGP